MSTPNANPLFPFEPQIQSMPSEHQYVIKNLWNVINDAQRAIPILKAQIDANKADTAANTKAINTNTTSQTVTPSAPETIGFVNDQTGNTTYATTQADYGAYIVFDDASPIAVSLTDAPVIQLPWYCVIFNFGVGLVTATPASGTITYPNNLAAASIPVSEGQAAIVSFDGTNYWAVIIIPPSQLLAFRWSNIFVGG